LDGGRSAIVYEAEAHACWFAAIKFLLRCGSGLRIAYRVRREVLANSEATMKDTQNCSEFPTLAHAFLARLTKTILTEVG
jgi:hypothetical protein